MQFEACLRCQGLQSGNNCMCETYCENGRLHNLCGRKMGFEFKITLPNLDADRAARVLRSAPFYSDYDASHQFFNFRDPGKDSSSWPAVWAKLDSDGIYLCHNGDRAVFQTVVDFIRQNVGQDFENFCMDEL